MFPLLRLEILTAEKKILSARDVRWIRAELIDGGIGIRPGHAPLVAETADGVVRYADEQGEHQVELRAGILDVRGDVVTIFTSLVFFEEIKLGDAPSSFDRLMAEIISGLVGGEVNAEESAE